MKESLVQIGFNENEARVYLAVLALGKPRIAQIVNKAGLSKKLCYKALESLIAQGYVAAEGRRKKVFFVTDIELIGQRLQERMKAFHTALPQLFASAGESHTLHSINTYTDPEAIRNLFKHQMRRQRRGSEFLVMESTRLHFVDFMNEGRGGATFDIYERVRMNRDIRLKLLFVDQIVGTGRDLSLRPEFETKYRRAKREIRELVTSVGNTLAGLYVWSDRVFLLTQRGSVMLLVELLNKDIRQGFVAYFESLWGMGKIVEASVR